MYYRLYQPGDFEALYAIEERCFQPPLRFPRGYMRQLVRSPAAATWIAEQASGMAGFAIVEWSREAGRLAAYIQTVEVAPEFRGQGIGHALMRQAEASALAAGAEIIWLHVDEHNAPAIHLYEAIGYSYAGREEGYYERRRAALIYSKELAPARAPQRPM